MIKDIRNVSFVDNRSYGTGRAKRKFRGRRGRNLGRFTIPEKQREINYD